MRKDGTRAFAALLYADRRAPPSRHAPTAATEHSYASPYSAFHFCACYRRYSSVLFLTTQPSIMCWWQQRVDRSSLFLSAGRFSSHYLPPPAFHTIAVPVVSPYFRVSIVQPIFPSFGCSCRYLRGWRRAAFAVQHLLSIQRSGRWADGLGRRVLNCITVSPADTSTGRWVCVLVLTRVPRVASGSWQPPHDASCASATILRADRSVPVVSSDYAVAGTFPVPAADAFTTPRLPPWSPSVCDACTTNGVGAPLVATSAQT